MPESIRSGRTARMFAAVLALAALGALPANAQQVRGRVVDAATRAPITGAHVMLLDTAGERVARALSNEDGSFLLGAAAAGAYLVRVEMIGRHSVESATLRLAAEQTADVTIELPARPISLEGLNVEAAQKCEVRPGSDGLTHTVWEEARKALAVEAAVRAEGAYRYNIQRYERETDDTRRRVTSEQVRHINRFTGDPFNARDAEYLMEEGFFEAREDGDFLYGPNAEVLLSDAFLDTHCFYLRRVNDRPDEIGLVFEPVKGRRISDIEGTLWINQQTAELRELQFTYVNLPGRLPQGRRGGHAEFLRLPNGAFIIRAWGIHAPLVRLENTGIGLYAQREERLFGFYEEGAEVLRITDQQGRTVNEARRAVLVGMVWDSTTNEPLADAQVYLVGTNIAGVTDANGRYRIPNIAPGIYQVSYRHAKTEEFRWFADPVEVEMERDQAVTLDFTLPKRAEFHMTAEEVAKQDSIASLGRQLGLGWDALLERERNAPSGRREVGRILGRVVDHNTNEPIVGALIGLDGTQYSMATNDKGEFRFFDVPVGTYTLVAEHLAYGRQTNPLDVKPNKYLDVSLRLAAQAIPLDTIGVEVEERSIWLDQNGFYDRRDQGGFGGHFISQADLFKRNTDWLTDLLEDVPGVRVLHDQGPGKRSIRFQARSGTGNHCEPDLYVDGLLYRNASPRTETTSSGVSYLPPLNKVDDFNVAPASNIAAIEVYVGTNVPVRFSNADNCGVVLIWLQR